MEKTHIWTRVSFLLRWYQNDNEVDLPWFQWQIEFTPFFEPPNREIHLLHHKDNINFIIPFNISQSSMFVIILVIDEASNFDDWTDFPNFWNNPDSEIDFENTHKLTKKNRF